MVYLIQVRNGVTLEEKKICSNKMQTRISIISGSISIVMDIIHTLIQLHHFIHTNFCAGLLHDLILSLILPGIRSCGPTICSGALRRFQYLDPDDRLSCHSNCYRTWPTCSSEESEPNVTP